MIVTCQECATQFQLDDAKVPAGGVRVRCSRCKHAFFIEPPGEAPELGRADRAAQEALDAQAPPEPEASQDLAAPADAAGSDFDDSDDPTNESDWEFNEAPFSGELSAGSEPAAAPDAAREAVDDLLGSRPALRTAAAAGASGPSLPAVRDRTSAPKRRIWGAPRAGICSPTIRRRPRRRAGPWNRSSPARSSAAPRRPPRARVPWRLR